MRALALGLRVDRGVDAEQLRLVVQHLLEVRDEPLRVDRVTREAAAEMIVDAALRHAARPLEERGLRGVAEREPARAREQLVCRARRKLRRAAEPAELRIAALRELRARRDDQRSVELSGLAAERAAPVVIVDA